MFIMKKIINYLPFLLLFLLAWLFYPVVDRSGWISSSDVHALLEFGSSLLAITAGIMVLLHFFITGRLLFLVISVGFVLIGSEEFIHAIFSFSRIWAKTLPILYFSIPATWLIGQFVLLTSFFAALIFGKKVIVPEKRKFNALVYCIIAFICAAFVVLLIFNSQVLPGFFRFGSSTKKFIEISFGLLYFAAFLFYFNIYLKQQSRSSLFWGISAFLVFRVLAQVFIFDTRAFYDSHFDTAHLLVFLSYFFPIFGVWGEVIKLHRSAQAQVIELAKEVAVRKKAEKEIKKFSDAVASAFDCLMFTDGKGNITYANESACATFGYTREEFLKLSINKLDADQDFAKKVTQEVAAKGKWSGEVMNIRKNGEKFPSFLSAFIIRDEEGNPKGTMGILRDIIEYKRAKEEILALSKFPSENPNPVLRIAKDGEILYSNKAGLELLAHWDVEIGEKAPERWRCLIKEALESAKPVSQEEEEEVKDKIFSVIISPVVETGYVNLYARDITERKKMGNALKKSLQLLMDTGEMAKVGGWEFDLATNEVSWTEEVTRIHGVEPGYKPKLEEALNFYAPESRPAVEAVVKKAAETGEPYDLESLFIPSGSKDKIWVRSLGKAVYSGGKIVKLVGTFQNIDKYKKVEEALQKNLTLYGGLIETTATGFVIMDQEGKVLDANQVYVLLSGHEDLSQIRGRSVVGWTADYEKEKNAEAVGKCFREGKIRNLEIDYVNAQGKITPVEINATVVKVNGAPQVLTLCRDITERRQVEEELRSAYKKLKQAQQELIQTSKMVAMGQLAAGISHELNQPLTGIKGFAQIVLMNLEKESPFRGDFNKIVEQVDRMDTIIKNVRFFARKSDFKMVELDINQIILNSLMLLCQQLKTHNVKVIQELGSDIPKIQGDPNQLQQAFLNIISNARDAILNLNRPEGGEIRIRTSLSQDKNHVEINFQDTGCGILDGNIQHIFSPFFTTKSPDRGMGLGLSITYRIIENHQGKIEFKSKEGEGTAFNLILPIKRTENATG